MRISEAKSILTLKELAVSMHFDTWLTVLLITKQFLKFLSVENMRCLLHCYVKTWIYEDQSSKVKTMFCMLQQPLISVFLLCDLWAWPKITLQQAFNLKKIVLSPRKRQLQRLFLFSLVCLSGLMKEQRNTLGKKVWLLSLWMKEGGLAFFFMTSLHATKTYCSLTAISQKTYQTNIS